MLFNLLDIDVRTLIAVLFWGNLISSFLFASFSFSHKNPCERNFYKYSISAKVSFFLAYMLLFFRGEFIDILSINFGNSLLMFGFHLESISLLKVRRTLNKRLLVLTKIILILAVLSFNIVEIIYPHAYLLITVASIGVFAILLVPTISLLLSDNSSFFKRLVGVLYAFFLIMLLPRAIIPLANKEITIFTNSPVQVLTFLSMVLIMIVNSSVYLLFIKEDTDKAMEILAKTDHLTGLPNRRSFLEMAQKYIKEHLDTETPIAMLFLDIDNFKIANDVYGHAFGDLVLMRFSQIIRDNIRACDLSCRYGGEEVVVLLTNIDSSSAINTAQRILNEIRKTVFIQQPEYRFTASIGIKYGIPKDRDSIDLFITQADEAMYCAKKSGKNKIMEHCEKERCKNIDV